MFFSSDLAKFLIQRQQPVMNYSSIAKLIRKPVSTVIELIKTAIGASIYGFSEENYSRSKFKHHQIGYLVSP
jgi:hypothetical protein